MNLKNIKAFTLIELFVSITILFIIVWTVYIPYSHYQNKLLLKQWTKEISQNIIEARNMSINWVNSLSWNLSIWLYLNSEDLNNEYIKYYSYPHFFTWSQIKVNETSDIKLIKSKSLPYGVTINKINWKSKYLFYFDSITWEGKYIYWDSLWNKNIFTWSLINIEVSFKNSSSQSLQKIINYYTKSNIIDYN